jgi:NAD-dependent SIR2 family protein deacetylase
MESEKIFYPEKEEERNLLLEGPELVSPEKENEQKGEMSFSFSSNTRRYYLGNKDGKPFFMVEYFNLLPDELNEVEKEKFTKETKKQGETENVTYVLKYGEVPELKEEMTKPDQDQNKKYRVAQSRDFEKGMIDSFIADSTNKETMNEILVKHSELNNEEISQIVEQIFTPSFGQDKKAIQALSNTFSKSVTENIKNEIKEKILPKPQEMETAQLVEILKDKKVLFYTGAGISMASGVHSMDQLEKTLGIEMSEKVDELIKKAVTNPQDVIDSWKEFTKAAFENPATPAHKSLGALAKKLKSQIFTENVDHLQEKSGIKATHLTGPWLKENIQPEWLKDIDAVITVGLSYDDRGFLGWYKENNPNGKIIAVNLSQPSYLEEEDFIIKEDCQKVFPRLEKEFAI